MRRLSILVVLLVPLLGRDAPADENPTTPVSATVVGHGSIRLVVADGSSRPCDASSNHMLFNAKATAGDVIKLTSNTGSVCVDHTYGAFRDSQWAGATIWSGARAWGSARAIKGTVSTDEP